MLYKAPIRKGTDPRLKPFETVITYLLLIRISSFFKWF